MNVFEVLAGLQFQVPLKIVPEYDACGKKVGHVIIDVIKAFCTPGCGNLAPRVEDSRIVRAIERNNLLAVQILMGGGVVVTVRDVHSPDTPEYPHPLHAERGSGHELLVDELSWLVGQVGVTDMIKHCINTIAGTMRLGGGIEIIDWIIKNQIQVLSIGGLCTDICVMEWAQTLMSIINMRQLQCLEAVVVVPDACATYDLPREVAIDVGVPPHPADIFHYIGLAMMERSGIVLAENLAI